MLRLNQVMELKSEASIEKACEYSENAEMLQNIIDKMSINAIFKGLENKGGHGENAIFKIEIEKNNKKIDFNFYQSINFTEIMMTEDSFSNEIRVGKKYYKRPQVIKMIKECKINFLYDVLCCIKNDGYIPNNFNDFCSECGYNIDSMKDFKLFNECIEQKNKIMSIFTESELECFPS